MTKTAIYVFSFNRPKFLKNCIHSIENLADSLPMVIIDDCSDDPDISRLLTDISGRYSVIANSRINQREYKTGGLAGCMNIAMEHARENNFRFAIFIQDDMQFVRRLEKSDITRIEDFFSHVPNSMQVSTNFIRELSASNFLSKNYINRDAHAYIRHPVKERGKSSFSDTGVFHVQRFHEFFESFGVGEGNNSEKARRLGLTCGRAFHPFMCWLPYPESYRGKRKGFKHLFFEYFGRSGYYPIEFMSDGCVAEFLNRDPDMLPVMERYLSAPTVPRADVWSTGGGEYNFVCYNGVAAKVFRAIRAIKRRIQGVDP